MAGSTQTLAETVTAMIGKPFVWQGRGPNAYDCWGVVHEILQATGCTDIPDYGTVDNPNSVIRVMAREVETPKWRQILDIHELQTGDVLLLSTVSHVFHHAGVWTPWGVVHATPKMGVIISRIRDLETIGYKHYKVYRWAGSA